MSEPNFEDSRTRRVASFSVLLMTMLTGAVAWRLWWLVLPASVALLYISDRGQHRWLADQFPGLDERGILWLSIVAHLGNNLFFCALSFVAGALTRWLWL